MSQFTPKNTVKELDRFIVGQSSAKRAVAIALRNRWRRQQIEGTMRNEIVPNNIILIGPTGVGKTEISRRLAKLAKAPFVKVEASKFTEVGYVGRDVESIIRDLTDVAMSIVKREKQKEVKTLAESLSEPIPSLCVAFFLFFPVTDLINPLKQRKNATQRLGIGSDKNY